jgi:hypothetical protein
LSPIALIDMMVTVNQGEQLQEFDEIVDKIGFISD